MARSRNIKPSFFVNEDIIELPFEARLLFIGLWTLADREGRLEYRPKKIKMALFPADEINVMEQLSNISKLGFIELYNIDGVDLIQITNFVKHQTPHGLEKDSELPDSDGLFTVYQRDSKSKTACGQALNLPKDQLDDFYLNKCLFDKKNNEFVKDTKRVAVKLHPKKQDNNSCETVSICDKNALIPESFNLIPESFNLNADMPAATAAEPAPAKKSRRKKPETSLPENFEISEAVRAWAEKKGFGDLEAHLESFKTKVQAKGYTYVDWDAALRNAISSDWAGLRKNMPNQAGQYRHHGQPAQAQYNPDDDIPECLREGYTPPPKRVMAPEEQKRIKAEQFAAAARYAAMVQEQKDQEAAKHAGTP